MAGATKTPPTIAANASPIMTLPQVDLKFHVSDLFITSLPSLIDSNHQIGANPQMYKPLLPN
jgi:hypothetical protein